MSPGHAYASLHQPHLAQPGPTPASVVVGVLSVCAAVREPDSVVLCCVVPDPRAGVGDGTGKVYVAWQVQYSTHTHTHTQAQAHTRGRG